MNGCANKLSCSIDVYDKHGLLLGNWQSPSSGDWGTAERLISLYLNDNHFDFITEITKVQSLYITADSY
jgi:hypothetical protein